jgi:hypothetical protein
VGSLVPSSLVPCLLVPYSGVNRWDLVSEYEVHRQIEGARAVLLELVVGMGLRARADGGICNVEVAGTCC